MLSTPLNLLLDGDRDRILEGLGIGAGVIGCNLISGGAMSETARSVRKRW